MHRFDAAATAALLDFPHLITALTEVLQEYDEGGIICPERLVVPCGGGHGFLLSMPCHARDLVVHKLLTVYGSNPSRGLPAIQGEVACFDAANGRPLFSLDGPTVTARRTAAITMLGIQRLLPSAPRNMLLIGTGAQAIAHVAAALECLPWVTIHVQGSSSEKAEAFCKRTGVPGRVTPATQDAQGACDVIVAVTSSHTPVFDEPAVPHRLVVGAGAYRLDMVEIGSKVIKASQVYVDDIVGAPGEAGDVVAAGTDWATVKTLATALTQTPDFSRPIFFKSVGCAAWDLAACRAAQSSLGQSGDSVDPR